METIGTIARKEWDKFKTTTVRLTEGEAFNQYKNLIRINKYSRGKFLEDNPDALFWQLSTSRIPLYAKSIDLDTKNFEMIGLGKFNWFKAFLLNVRFKQWARENRLALTLDDTSTAIATYGSGVWAKIYDSNDKVELEEVNLMELAFDQTVKNIIDSPVVRAHYWTETKIRKMYPDKANEIIKTAEALRDSDGNQAESEDESYEILERWGEFKEEEDKDAKYFHWIGVGEGDAEVEIVKDEIDIDSNGKPKEFPYYDFHGERVARRWQGLGVVERLFNEQEEVNTLVNQNSDANDIASLLLFRTADPETQGNVLDSVRTGQVINSADMQQLAIDNRFIQTFIAQLQAIEKKADDLCYINDSISGDTPPSGVPFRSLAVATKAAASTFRYIKTSIGEKMGFILQEAIMPEVVKGFNREDMINIREEDGDMRLFDQTVIEYEVKKWMLEKASKGMVIFEEDLAQKKQDLQTKLQREGRSVEIGKKFFDFKWGIYMNPTGESVDKNTQNAAIDGALEYMAANPNIVNTPLFQQKLENNGIPPFRLTTEEIQSLSATQGQSLPEAPTTDKLSQLAEIS